LGRLWPYSQLIDKPVKKLSMDQHSSLFYRTVSDETSFVTFTAVETHRDTQSITFNLHSLQTKAV
jgi:hypothetical protein